MAVLPVEEWHGETSTRRPGRGCGPYVACGVHHRHPQAVLQVGAAPGPRGSSHERVVTDKIRGELNEAKYDTLAVYPFDVQEYDPAGASLSMDRVEHWLLARPEFDIVSRQHLETVLDEQDIAETARFDSVTVTMIGRLVGAKAVVVGSLYGSAPEPSWSLQIIDAETGQIAWGEDGTGLLEDQIDDALGPLVDHEIRRTESYMAKEVERVDVIRTQVPCPEGD